MNSELLQEFLTQAESYLPTIRGGILICVQEGNKHGALNTSLSQVNLIKDAASVSNLENVAQTTEELEEKLKISIAAKQSLTDDQSRQLLDKLTELEILLAQLRFETEDFSDDIDDFVEQSFDNLQRKQSNSVKVEENKAATEEGFELDAEMLEIFSLEAEELVQSISSNLKTLKKTPNNREALLEIRRNAHTLKGSAGIVGLKQLSAAAHRVEDLLDYLAEKEIEADEKIFELLFVSTDCFSALASGENSAQLTKKIAWLYETFDAVIASLKKNDRNIPDISKSKLKTGIVSSLIEDADLPENSASIATNQNRSIVRVSLEKLDDLVKIVSGLVISRSVFEQRLEEFEQQIGELHNSTRRLQHSTAKLETDFESDMLNVENSKFKVQGSRFQVPRHFSTINDQSLKNSSFEISDSQSFDSLELDCYTDFHQTMRELVETTSDTFAINTELDNLQGNLEQLFENQRHLIEDMQDKLLHLRLVSFSSLNVRLQRTVRVTCDEEGKSADLSIEDENLEVDTQILDSLIEPLLHLLRNAVAHGIEPPEMRRLLGKLETGKINVRVKSEGTHIILTVSDDGRGIFADGLKEKALRDGFITRAQAAKMSDEEAFSLMFLAGLTTTDKISQISGRGVGMNIVKQSIERQQGTISIHSKMQRGTTFTIRMPMALAVTRALLVKASEQTFAFPLKLVKQASKIPAADLEKAKTKNLLKIGDVNYSIVRLNELLGLPSQTVSNNETIPILLLGTLENPCALVVDEIIKPEEIVIKPLGSPMKNLAELLGATILGDGSVVPVLDLVYLLEKGTRDAGQGTRNESEGKSGKDAETNLLPARPSSLVPRPFSVLIVDDSPSVRHLTSNIINNAGWTAILAKDGLEALEILQEAREMPNVILSDVEMPRMDGYELLSSLKRQKNLQAIPVVMITSRANKKHHQKAVDLGASEYLTKPFDDAKLIEVIKKLTA